MAHRAYRKLSYSRNIPCGITSMYVTNIDGVGSWTQNSDSAVNNTGHISYTARDGDTYVNPGYEYTTSFTREGVYADCFITYLYVSPQYEGDIKTNVIGWYYDRKYPNEENNLYYNYNDGLVKLSNPDKYFINGHSYIDCQLDVTSTSYFNFGWWNSDSFSPSIKYSIRLKDRPTYQKIKDNGTVINWANNTFLIRNVKNNLSIPDKIGGTIKLSPSVVSDEYSSDYIYSEDTSGYDEFTKSGIVFNVSNEQITIRRTRNLAPTNITYDQNLLVYYTKPSTGNSINLYGDGELLSNSSSDRISIPYRNLYKKIKYHLTTAKNSYLYYDKDKESLYIPSGSAAIEMPITGIVKAELEYVAYDESLASNSFYCYKLRTPTNLNINRVNINSVELIWDNVEYAETYSVYLDNVKQPDIAYNSLYLSNLSKGNHVVKVVAHSSTGYDSDYSSEFNFSINSLDAPNISVNELGNGIVWPDYDSDTNKPSGYEVQDFYTGVWVYLNTVSTKYFLLTNEAFKPEIGAHIFRVRAVVLNAYGEVDEIWSSDWSNTVEVDIQTLDKPTAYLELIDGKESSIIRWNSVPNAEYYNVYLDDIKINTDNITTNAYYGLRKYIGDKPSVNQISVRAMSNNIIYANSGYSNRLYYRVSKITRPSNLNISSTGLLTWNSSTANYLESDNRIIYDIYSTDHYVASTYDLQYQMTLEAGNSYIIKIKARETTQNDIYPNPYFLESDYSDIITIGKYQTPTNLTAETNGYLYWSDIDNAKEYSIYNYGELVETAEVNRYRIPSIPGSYSYTVKVNSYGNITESDMSNNLNVTVIKLDTPVLTINNVDEYIMWNYISGAQSYDIYINGVKFTNTTNNRYYFGSTINGGTNQFYVKAIHSSELIINSERSNIVTSNKLVKAKMYAKIKENGVWSDPIELELPVSITDTYDNSIPRATITLCPNSRDKEYQSKTDVCVSWNDDSGLNPYKVKYYIVDSDTVTEYPSGKDRYYSHTLSLLDRRRELQEISMPSISITQPQDFVYNEYKYGAQNILAPDLGGNYIPVGVIYNDGDKDTWTTITQTIGAAGLGAIAGVGTGVLVACVAGGPVGWAIGLGVLIGVGIFAVLESTVTLQSDICNIQMFSSDKTQIPMYDSVDSSWRFALPFMQTNKTSKWIQRQWFNKVQVLDNKIYKNEDSYLTQRWFIRKHPENVSDKYSKLSDYPEVEIASYNASVNSEYPSFCFNDSEYYVNNSTNKKWDLILEIDDVPDGRFEYDNKFLNDSTALFADIKRLNLPLMSSKYLGGNDRVGTPDRHFRMVWSGIESEYHSGQTTVTDCVFVSDALNKICECANALKYGDSPKYSIDPMIIAMTSNLPIYQLKFVGKTMYECLETIGKEFLGIPYLKEDTNVISFSIRDEKVTYSNEGFEDKLTNVASSIDNNSTGFVCDAVNMISKEGYEVYPGKDMWISPRATDENSAYVTTTTCGIVLDKPIAYLQDIEVTGFDNLGNTLHITPYCYEKTVYDSLSADNEGKGSAIYWQIGSNKIMGLGVLEKYFSAHANNDTGTAVDWIGRALDLSPTNYAIQNILRNKFGVNLDNSKVKDLKFRITYIPYNNARVYLEQFNTSDSQKYSYKIYNQTDSTIVDSSFGSAANKEIQRLGNNTRTTQFISTWNKEELNAGDTVLFDDSIYYIDVITKEYYAGYIINNISLTKDYNKINDRIGVNSEYRQYEIYNKDFAERSLNINHYCYLSTKSDYDYNDANKTGIWTDILKDALNGNPHDSLDTFYINVYSKDDKGNLSTLRYTDYDGNTVRVTNGFAIHASRLVPRNSIAFSGKMLDNYAVGYMSNTSNVYEGKYENKALRYVDDKGELYAIDIALGNPTISQLYGEYNKDNAHYMYPKCNKIANPSAYNITDCVFSNRYIINKDNRESLEFMYQMHFKTDENKFDLHQGLTKYLFKSGDIFIEKPIIVGYNGPISNKENLSYDKDDIIGEINVKLDSDGVAYIDSLSFIPNKNYEGFAVIYTRTSANDSGLMLFSYKDFILANNTYTTPKIYFNFKDKQIER